MKKWLQIFVVFFILKPLFPLVVYAIRYDYIVNELCVNKDNPQMRCNGKCHLREELAKTSTGANAQDKYKFPVFETLLFFYIDTAKMLFKKSKDYILQEFFYCNTYCFLNCIIFFQPPKA